MLSAVKTEKNKTKLEQIKIGWGKKESCKQYPGDILISVQHFLHYHWGHISKNEDERRLPN